MGRKACLAWLLGLMIACSCVGLSQDQDLQQKVDAYLAPFIQGKNFTGAVLIARGGRVLVNKGYGEANYSLHVNNTPATRFHIASISKPFTAAAILLLEERGQLSTSDKLSRYVPDFPRGEEITLLHLLTHTSGIVNVNDLPEYAAAQRAHQTPRSLIELFKDKPLNFAPGARYEYSNSNYNLLALIIEKVSGKSYGEFLRDNILQPQGLVNTAHDGEASDIIPGLASGYEPRGVAESENAPCIDWSAKTGNGSLYSTTGDLLKFVQAYAHGKIVKRETVAQVWSEHHGNRFGWFARQRHGELAVASNGRSPGFTSSVEYHPGPQLAVIVLSNSYSPVSQSPIAEDLAAMALGKPVQPAGNIVPVAVSAVELNKVAGAYRFGADFFRPNAEVTVRVENGEPVLDWGGGFKSALVPLGHGEYVDRQFWARLKMNRDGSGFTYSSSGQDFQVSRVRR